MSVYDLLLDFTFASILILISQFLRAKVTILQKLFMPASLIAGFLGLFLGKRFLNVIPFSDNIGSYAGALIIIVFTTIGINGFTSNEGGTKDVVKRATSYMLYRFFLFFLQLSLPIAVTLLVLCKVFPNLNPGFGMLLASGFYGGHGTAAAVGATFADLGWAEANDLAVTFATVGILSGIIGGLAFIKWAARKKHTVYIKDFAYSTGALRTGLIPKEERISMGDETISPVSLDSLGFNLSIILACGGLGYALNKFILKPYVISGIPDMTCGFLIGLLFFLVFRKTKVYDYMDKKVNSRISGAATDFLVFFAVASINTTVIIENIVPLLVLILVGLFCTFLCVVPFGYRMNKDSWFERSIFVFGQFTGVFATGFVLLRIVDPENKCAAIEDTAMTPYMYFVEAFVWAATPAALMAGKGWLLVALYGGLAVVSLVLGIIGKMWYKEPLNERKAV